MPRTKNERKEPDKMYGFRLKESEYRRIRDAMESYGYNSFSSYVRDCLFSKRVYKEVKITDRSLRDQINKQTLEIKKIGNLVNQVARAVNSVVNKRRKNGDPVVNTTVLKNYEEKLNTYFQRIIDLQNQTAETVEQISIRNGQAQ